MADEQDLETAAKGSDSVEQQMGKLAWLRSLAGTLTSRRGIANAAGSSFDGNRQVWDALGYPKDISLEMYRGRFERGGIAGRIVDAYPNQTWRGGGLVTDDMDPDVDTEFEIAWLALEERLKLWPMFNRTDILAGLGDYAVLLIGAPGKFDEPLERAAAEQIIYVQPYSQVDVEVKTLVSDGEDPRFSLPETYTFGSIGQPTAVTSRTTKATIRGQVAGREQVVHWTRVIHVADGILDDNIHGRPRLRRIWNHLEDLDKVIGGGAEAFWNRANQGFVTEFDKDLKMSPEDLKDLNDQMDAFAHRIIRNISQRGAKTTALGSDVAEFNESADAIVMQISAATGIPHRILTGSERGELASSQDKNNWNERISDRREGFAEAQVVRPFVDLMLMIQALPTPAANEYAVKWPEIKNLDEGEKAEVAEGLANVNKAAGTTVVTVDEIRTGVLDLPPLSDVEDLPDDSDLEDDEDAAGAVQSDDADDMTAAAGRKKKAGTRPSAIWARKRALKTSPTGWRFMAPQTHKLRARRRSLRDRLRLLSGRSGSAN